MSATNASKPGRKCLGDRPMTARERNARYRAKIVRPAESLSRGTISAGQVWEVGRGLGMKPAVATVVSVSAMGLWGVSGYRVYMRNNASGRLLNVSHQRMTKGLDCRRLS